MEEIFKEIKDKNYFELIDLAKSKKFENFQYSSYFTDYFRIKTSFKEIEVNSELITYNLAGKIMMECYGDMFRYFENVIKNQEKDNPLNKTIRVMIDQ